MHILPKKLFPPPKIAIPPKMAMMKIYVPFPPHCMDASERNQETIFVAV